MIETAPTACTWIVFRPRLSEASVLKAMTVSACCVFAVSERVGGTLSLCGSMDVESLHAATPRETETAAAATMSPRRRAAKGAIYIRVTFNGWLVGSDSTMHLVSARRRR